MSSLNQVYDGAPCVENTITIFNCYGIALGRCVNNKLQLLNCPPTTICHTDSGNGEGFCGYIGATYPPTLPRSGDPCGMSSRHYTCFFGNQMGRCINRTLQLTSCPAETTCRTSPWNFEAYCGLNGLPYFSTASNTLTTATTSLSSATNSLQATSATVSTVGVSSTNSTAITPTNKGTSGGGTPTGTDQYSVTQSTPSVNTDTMSQNDVQIASAPDKTITVLSKSDLTSSLFPTFISPSLTMPNKTTISQEYSVATQSSHEGTLYKFSSAFSPAPSSATSPTSQTPQLTSPSSPNTTDSLATSSYATSTLSPSIKSAQSTTKSVSSSLSTSSIFVSTFGASLADISSSTFLESVSKSSVSYSRNSSTMYSVTTTQQSQTTSLLTSGSPSTLPISSTTANLVITSSGAYIPMPSSQQGAVSTPQIQTSTVTPTAQLTPSSISIATSDPISSPSSTGFSTSLIAIVSVVCVIGVAVLAGIGLIFYRKSTQRRPSQPEAGIQWQAPTAQQDSLNFSPPQIGVSQASPIYEGQGSVAVHENPLFAAAQMPETPIVLKLDDAALSSSRAELPPNLLAPDKFDQSLAERIEMMRSSENNSHQLAFVKPERMRSRKELRSNSDINVDNGAVEQVAPPSDDVLPAPSEERQGNHTKRQTVDDIISFYK